MKKKFEYKIIRSKNIWKESEEVKFMDFMNELGKDGWEAIGYRDNRQGHIKYHDVSIFLKRKIDE